MSYTVLLSGQAEKELDRLDRSTGRRVREAITTQPPNLAQPAPRLRARAA